MRLGDERETNMEKWKKLGNAEREMAIVDYKIRIMKLNDTSTLHVHQAILELMEEAQKEAK